MFSYYSEKLSHSSNYVHLLLILAQITFGTVNVFGKIALESLEPLPLTCLRYLMSIPFALVLSLIFEMDSLKESLKNFPKTIKYLGLLGLINAGGMASFFYGLRLSNPINVGILYLSTVPITAAIGMIFNLEERMILKVVGVCFSLGGTLLMAELDKFKSGNETLIGDLIIVGTIIAYSVYLVFTGSLSIGLKPFTLSLWMFIFSGLIILIPIIILYPLQIITITSQTYFTLNGWIAVFIVCIIGTTIPYICNNWALTVTTSLVVAIYTPLELIVTIILGVILLNLQITWQQGVGTILIITGLLIVLYAKRLEKKRNELLDDEETHLQESHSSALSVKLVHVPCYLILKYKIKKLLKF
jgi:drug/metabolite transporter (DMT)-like permease